MTSERGRCPTFNPTPNTKAAQATLKCWGKTGVGLGWPEFFFWGEGVNIAMHFF